MALNLSDFLLTFLGVSVILLAEVIKCDISRLGREFIVSSFNERPSILIDFIATVIYL